MSNLTTSIEKRFDGTSNDQYRDSECTKDFQQFPETAQSICLNALTIAANGGKADIAKRMKGLGAGVFEIALPCRGDAFRVVYAVQLGDDLWVIHAFQKKATQGIKTPKRDIDLVKDRIKRLKQEL